MKDAESFLSALHARTELEELLDWNSDLVDYLFGAWSSIAPMVRHAQGEEAKITLLAAQLPHGCYEKYKEKLEQWVTTNYNLFVR